jgi:Kef-type K+ transport system membrane component KefB
MPFSLPITDPALQLTFVVGAVLLMRLVFDRIHLPGLIGLLLAGMVLGPGGFEVLPKAPFIDLLGSVGLIFIMFTAGAELDLDAVRTHRSETVSFGLLAFALSIIPAIGAGMLFMDFGWSAAILFGALISSHTLISYPMVRKIGLLHRKSVVAAVGGTLITDTLALTALVFVMQTANVEHGNGIAGGPWMTFALLAVLIALSLWLVPRLIHRVFGLAHLGRAEKALFVLLIILSLAMAAKLIGAEDILGAFLAGLCLNKVLKEREDLSEHVHFAGRMLFIPFFFVATGMQLNFAVFTGRPETWYLAGLLVGLVIFGKTAAAWIVQKKFGYTRNELVLMVAMTLPQAAATLAIANAAREAELFDESVLDAVIILIFVTSLTGPLLTKWAGKRMAASME